MNIIYYIAICVARAFFCALPGFIIDLFVDLGAKKHYLFLALALASSVYASSHLANTTALGTLFVYILVDLFGVYFGLFFLIALKNMGRKFGLCKVCDKIKARLRRRA